MLKFLFNKVAGHQVSIFKKRLQHRCFPINTERCFYRTPPPAASRIILIKTKLSLHIVKKQAELTVHLQARVLLVAYAT